MSTSAHPPPPHTPTPLQRRIPNALTVGRLVLTAAFVALVIGGVLVLTQVGHGDETDANDPCAAVHSIEDL